MSKTNDILELITNETTTDYDQQNIKNTYIPGRGCMKLRVRVSKKLKGCGVLAFSSKD